MINSSPVDGKKSCIAVSCWLDPEGTKSFVIILAGRQKKTRCPRKISRLLKAGKKARPTTEIVRRA